MQALLDFYYDIETLASAGSLFAWDMQTKMPRGGGESRGIHMMRIAKRHHQLLTSDEFGNLLAKAQPSSAEDEATLRVLNKDRKQAMALPASLVQRKHTTMAKAYPVWRQAKQEDNFALLEPYYKELFDIARESAELYGYKDHPYDALINLYEEGTTTAQAQKLLGALKGPVIQLVRQIEEEGQPNDDLLLYQDWDQNLLAETVAQMATKIGYDFNRGRLDLTTNAFCTTIGGRGDVRMTSRPSEHIKGVLSSTLHEMGHALYEQGIPAKYERTPLGGGISLSVHESQSRTWENMVGRSQGFWRHFFPALATTFPDVLGGLSDHDFYRMINKVSPSFIRVGADELTYNLHILIRFELEVDIITGKLQVKDLPEAWNAKYTDYLGITPPTNSVGCLQDVHWSRGSAGYFPTYSLGNLIGAQIWSTLVSGIGEQEENFARGDFAPVLGWLTEKIYSQGRLYTSHDLVERVCGAPVAADAWLKYAKEKYSAIYGLSA